MKIGEKNKSYGNGNNYLLIYYTNLFIYLLYKRITQNLKMTNLQFIRKECILYR